MGGGQSRWREYILCAVAQGGVRIARILLVDDEPDIRVLTRMILEKAGYDVIEAGDGDECLRKLNEDKPDLILLDIIMPGIDGWEVCRRTKEIKPRISVPVSMLSVRKDEEDIKRSFEYANDDAHLGKPVNIKALLGTWNGH